MKYRHEIKHEINYADLLTLRMRLQAVMTEDKHANHGVYRIRSLYFDSLSDKALREKIDGVNRREKFRIRYYNDDTTYIVLEKKSKIDGLCAKESCQISKEQANQLVAGHKECFLQSQSPLCRELYAKMQSQGLKPKTIVDYTREPFVFLPGNVRVTLDYDIRTGDFRTDFLNPHTLTLPTGDRKIILEVKWDEYLPDIIKSVVSINGRMACAFSKYEQCRIYG